MSVFITLLVFFPYCSSSTRVAICSSSVPPRDGNNPACVLLLFQMPGRGLPRGSPWTASSITRRCCSARRTTCCTWERGRRCSPSASPTSARPSCRRTYVCLWTTGSVEAGRRIKTLLVTLTQCCFKLRTEAAFIPNQTPQQLLGRFPSQRS